MSRALWLIVADIVLVVGLSVLIGAIAPHWPLRWMDRDLGPLHLTPLDTPRNYRRLGVPAILRVLPELGTMFGGASKRVLPGVDAAALKAYLREVRRAEWVHWLSCLTVVPLMFFNPWWLVSAFAVVVIGGNCAFIAVLRHNRIRLLRILNRG